MSDIFRLCGTERKDTDFKKSPVKDPRAKSEDPKSSVCGYPKKANPTASLKVALAQFILRLLQRFYSNSVFVQHTLGRWTQQERKSANDREEKLHLQQTVLFDSCAQFTAGQEHGQYRWRDFCPASCAGKMMLRRWHDGLTMLLAFSVGKKETAVASLSV